MSAARAMHPVGSCSYHLHKRRCARTARHAAVLVRPVLFQRVQLLHRLTKARRMARPRSKKRRREIMNRIHTRQEMPAEQHRFRHFFIDNSNGQGVLTLFTGTQLWQRFIRPSSPLCLPVFLPGSFLLPFLRLRSPAVGRVADFFPVSFLRAAGFSAGGLFCFFCMCRW